MKTKGHHTCLLEGHIDTILMNAPFLAEDKPRIGRKQFLGTGYYFWDNNLPMANAWGKFHYRGKYAIVEIDFDIKSDTCYDLVGNRSHQIDITIRLNKLLETSGNDKPRKWTLRQYFLFILKLADSDCKIFPYKMVRAIDLLNHIKYKTEQDYINFTENKKNYTLLNPKIVICVFDKNTLNLQSKKLVYPT